jgi:hypothetical protein
MSYARGMGQNGGHFYSNITQPVKLDLNFVVDSTNGNGLGIRSLKSNGYVKAVYMHTSATPAAGNPNPAAGYCLIQFKNNFNKYLGGFSGFVSPVSGTPLTATTAHNAYIIVSLGTATLAQWQAVGVPPGLTPAVGMSFVATASATIGGSAAVEVPSVSGITTVEVVGDPNQSIANKSIAQNGGAYLLVQFLGATDSATTTLTATAPANGSVCGMSAFFDLSSVSIPDAAGQSGL